MKLSVVAATASTLLFASSLANAQSPPPDVVQQANAEAVVGQSEPSAAAAPAEQLQAVRHELIEPILAELARRSAKPADDNERNWISELTAYYGTAETTPLWVFRDGYLPRGWEAYHILRYASDYGLDETAFPTTEFTPHTTPASADLAATEVQMSLNLVRYAWYARGGRLDPSQLSLWLSPHKPSPIHASELMQALANSPNITATMRAFHPHHPQFEKLRLAYLAERGTVTPATTPTPLASGPRLKRGARHSDVALVRKRLGVSADEGDADLLDRELMAKISEYMVEQGYGRKRVLDDEVRSALSKPVRQRQGAKKAQLDKYLVNMERWRWLPADFGNLYVWNNLPEFQTRVMKDGAAIHEERIVIGTPKTQTPVFSDSMSHVIFQPEWGVPESIKIRDLLPRLRAGDTSVLTRRNMRIYADGREIRPSRFNWAKVDPRNVPIVQRAGPGNPLGKLKFIFPNAHDVYMHDTPSKELFNEKERTFSHGCIRVRNPQRLAEVILGEVEGWTVEDVKRQLANRETRKVDLRTQVPVHNTYFTLVANPDGTVASLKDVYNYDRRVLDALNGKSLQLIAANDPALALKKENEKLKKQVAWKRPAPPTVRVQDRYYRSQPQGFFWFNSFDDDD